MPRFFFDTHDGGAHFHDEVGVDLAAADDVPEEAFGLLRDMTHHGMPRGETVLTASVRDMAGTVVFRATMAIVSDWCPRGTD